MDGVGIGPRDEGDAVWLARTPNLDWLARARARPRRCARTAPRSACRATTTWATARSATTRSARAASSTRAPSSSNEAIAERRALRAATAWKAARRARARARRAAALHRPALRRQRPQPHRPPDRDAARAPTRTGVRAGRACTRCSTAATCPRRSALDYVDALEELLAELSAARPRLPHRLRRRPHDRSPWTATRPTGAMVERGWKTHVLGEGRAFRQRARGDRDALRARSRASSTRTCRPS